jgi:hypothetical protein
MRALRINGWQRIGIVLSVLWAIGAAAYTQHMLFDPVYERFHECAAAVTNFSFCTGTMHQLR